MKEFYSEKICIIRSEPKLKGAFRELDERIKDICEELKYSDPSLEACFLDDEVEHLSTTRDRSGYYKFDFNVKIYIG